MTAYEGRKGLKQLQKIAHKGMELYVVYEGHGRFPGAPSKYYSKHVLDCRGGFSGQWMSGTASIQQLLTYGPIYDAPPPGVQNLDGPLPQVAGPAAMDLDVMEKEVQRINEERKRWF